MTVFASIVSVVVAAVGTYLAFLQHRRADFERAERLLDYATTGEIALARHLLGSQPWVRCDTASRLPGDATANELTEALFRLAWAFDRIYVVRSTVRGQPRKVIDAVLRDWVLWWGSDSSEGCRFGRVAHTLGALDKEEHDHLGRLVDAMTAGVGADGGRRCASAHTPRTSADQ
ncbi:hypothetical protein [Cellulomonas sp. P24]|uniref:hypothetical protein n=1 Tax=Cellulomonas sp. P24 TaxID=2885206 RepID=UPI00216ABF14|nr:hypothetical protein [Cellulomonas sp. P24]MCR6491430.1 hypothetical protein [Cellulomonas sp. P24]